MEQRMFISEIQILKEIAETLNECSNLEKMLTVVLQKLLQITSLETGWIFLFDENGQYRLAASESLPPALKDPIPSPMSTGDCWCVNRYRNGELLKASNIMECKRLELARINKNGDTLGLTYHATVPLSAGDEQFGLLNVAVTKKEKFEQEELRLLESIALQIGTALKRIQLAAKEQEMTILEERNRLARDLHDSVNQLLYSINVTSHAGIKLSQEPSIQKIFSDIQTMSQHAQVEMKGLIWQLRPEGLKNGLLEGLKTYGRILGLKVVMTVEGHSPLPIKVEETLWRICQEAFHNIVKYAGVKQVSLHVSYDANLVTLTIQDDGIGFQYTDGLPTLGLKSMEERVNALSGVLKIESNLGKGTAVLVRLPLQGGGNDVY